MTVTAASAKSLSKKARHGLGWSLLNQGLGRVTTLLSGIVLARLLSPNDYGVYAVALVVLNAMLSMNELGVSVALIRWPGDPKRIAPTVATLSVLGSFVFFAACQLLAGPLARELHAPAAEGVLRLLSVAVIVDGIAAVPAAMLTREFKQGWRLIVDISAMVVSSVVTVILAAMGYGVWSFGWGSIAGNATILVVLYFASSERYLPGLDRTVAKEVLAFGLPLAGSSLLVFCVLNVDYVVVGRTLGPTALGLYLFAFNLSSWPVNMISTSVRRVALPYFAQMMAKGGDVSQSFSNSFGLLVAVTAPVCALLAVLGLPLIHVVYGEKWATAAGALSLLAILGGVRVIFEVAYDFIVAAGRPRITVVLQASWLAFLIPGLIIGAHVDGIRGVAAAHALIAGGVMGPMFAIAVHRQGVHFKDLAKAAALPTLATIGLVATAELISAAIQPTLLRLLVGGTASVLVYAAIASPMRHRVKEAVREPDVLRT